MKTQAFLAVRAAASAAIAANTALAASIDFYLQAQDSERVSTIRCPKCGSAEHLRDVENDPSAKYCVNCNLSFTGA